MSAISSSTTREIQGIDRLLIEASTAENTVYNAELLQITDLTDEVVSADSTNNGLYVGWAGEETISKASNQGKVPVIMEPKWINQTITGGTSTKIGHPVYNLNNNDLSHTRPAAAAKCVGFSFPYKGTEINVIDPGVAAMGAAMLTGHTKERVYLGTYVGSDIDSINSLGHYVPGGKAKVIAYGFEVNKAMGGTDGDVELGLYSGTTLVATTDTVDWTDADTGGGTAAGSNKHKALTTPYEVHDAGSISVQVVGTTGLFTIGVTRPYIDIEYCIGS